MTVMESKTSTMKWYIVRAQANREKSVSERLIKEGEKGSLFGKIGQVIVPMEKTYSIRGGKKVVREKVMYPGYIFIETNAIGELKYFIKGCDGASGILGGRNGESQEIKDSEISKMIGVQKEITEKRETENKYIIGEEVRIIEGPFSGFYGTLEQITEAKVKLSVTIFGRNTPVELAINQVEKK